MHKVFKIKSYLELGVACSKIMHTVGGEIGVKQVRQLPWTPFLGVSPDISDKLFQSLVVICKKL